MTEFPSDQLAEISLNDNIDEAGNHFDFSQRHQSDGDDGDKQKVSPQAKQRSTTNFSETSLQARIGNSDCFQTIKAAHSGLAGSQLSSKYAGGPRIGTATCWNNISKWAWELALPAPDENKHIGEKPQSNKKSIDPKFLQILAENSVRKQGIADLPEEEAPKAVESKEEERQDQSPSESAEEYGRRPVANEAGSPQWLKPEKNSEEGDVI
jgi:hypothetical protein